MNGTAVIGMGAACAAGIGVDTAWPPVAGGLDKLEPLSLFHSGLKQPPLCAQCPSHLNRELGERVHNRTTALALLAAREALAGTAVNSSSLRLGLVTATTVGGMTRSEQFYRQLLIDQSVLTHASNVLSHHEPTCVTHALARRYNPDISIRFHRLLDRSSRRGNGSTPH
jgi:hypothetical protein